MNIYEKIKQIYPSLSDLDFDKYIILQNNSDGKGDYIEKWEHPSFIKPNNEQLKG